MKTNTLTPELLGDERYPGRDRRYTDLSKADIPRV